VVIASALLYWAMQGVDFRAALAFARNASAGWLAGGVAVATLPFLIRVPRWQQLLRTDTGTPIPLAAGWHAIAIGFMANNVVPRSGELLRAWVASRLAPVTFTTALSSVAVERIFDGLTITTMLALALFSPDIPADAMVGETRVQDLAVRAGRICLVLLAGAMLVAAMPALAERWMRRVIPWPKAADKLAELMQGVVHGLGAMKSASRLAAVIVWSVVLWTVGAISFWMIAKAFGLEMGLGAAFVLQGVLAFGVALPSTPGYVGIFEGVIVAVLTAFGVDKDLAFAYAVTYHVTTFLPITLLGAISVLRTPISMGDLRGRRA
jgi:uncharacterized protein (TIRG00374 family)